MVLLVFSALHILYENRRIWRFILLVWKKFSFRMILEIIPVISFVAISSYFLYTRIPFLRWGWTSLLADKNFSINQAIFVVVSDNPGSLLGHIILMFILIILLLVLPFAAKEEEEIFRKGHYKWRQIIPYSIAFGLSHLILGIPIAIGISLIGSGIFLAYKYKIAFERFDKKWIYGKAEDEALIISITYHTLINSVLFGFVLLLEILQIFIIIFFLE